METITDLEKVDRMQSKRLGAVNVIPVLFLNKNLHDK